MSVQELAPEQIRVTRTLVTRLRERGEQTPQRVALRQKLLGIWTDITWGQYWDAVQDVAHSLLALGIESGDRVAIHSENRPEWVYADLATVAVRGVSVGLYPTNPAPEVEHLLKDSGSRLLIAEDQEQVDKALEVKEHLPNLERIVYLQPRGLRSYRDPLLMSWEEFLERGRAHRNSRPDALPRLMDAAQPDDIATLVYTSGTTGPPKGAMLTVANIEAGVRVAVELGALTWPPPTEKDVMLSYLPLCHAAEKVFTEWFGLAAGAVVHFAESVDTVQADLAEVQPTIFLGMPRIWEKMRSLVEIRVASASPFKRLTYRFWSRVAERIGKRLIETEGNQTVGTRVAYAIGWLFFFRALKERLGLRKCRYAISGAAPISPELLAWLMGYGIPVHEAYGMTESTGVTTANRPGRIKVGTVGEPMPDIEVRLDDSGEVLIRSPLVFPGYWGMPEATAKTIDEDGWLHTGDVGEWVGETHLRIIDRVKDVMITAGGKNISPSELENALKNSPYIKEAIVVGDQRPFVSALLGIEQETVADWAQRQGIGYTTYRDLSEKPEVRRLMQEAVDEANQRFPRVAQVRKFDMLPKELDHEEGEITATQKVKRTAIANMFEDRIEGMYRKSR